MCVYVYVTDTPESVFEKEKEFWLTKRVCFPKMTERLISFCFDGIGE